MKKIYYDDRMSLDDFNEISERMQAMTEEEFEEYCAANSDNSCDSFSYEPESITFDLVI